MTKQALTPEFVSIVIILFLACFNTPALATSGSGSANPILAFSDIINGPATGLDDGLGEGAIVTLWGYHLGNEKGQVYFTDSSGQKREAAHIYYWKRADGNLPGGPANLYRSHNLYEVAFSVPNSPTGTGSIHLVTPENLISNELEFKVVEGRIFHTKHHGDNDNPGNFEQPWQFINGDRVNVPSAGNGKLMAGDIVYSHNITESLTPGEGRAAIFLRNIHGKADKHVALIAYPGTRSSVISETWGLHPYLSSGIVISKHHFAGGNMPDPGDDSDYVSPFREFTIQIRTTQNGRVVGNHITDMPGRCSNGQAGSISGTGDNAINVTIVGNEITGIGCRQTSHFHHTTYLSHRRHAESDTERKSTHWQFAWNYLHDNMARYGIHFYDQTLHAQRACADLSGVLDIHDNLIVNQRGPGINVFTTSRARNNPCWKVNTNVYKNILINTGLGPRSEPANGTAPFAIKIGGAIQGNFKIYNNLIYGVSDHSSRLYRTPEGINVRSTPFTKSVQLTENIIETRMDMLPFTADRKIELSNNYPVTESFLDRFLSRFNEHDKSEVMLTINKNKLKYDNPPATIMTGSNPYQLSYDFYGYPFGDTPKIGPIQRP